MSETDGPCLAILLFYVSIYPTTSGFGYHAESAQNLAFLVVGIPLPLAYLYYLGRIRNKSWSLRDVVLYRVKIPRAHYEWILVFMILFGVYAGAAASLAQPVATYLRPAAGQEPVRRSGPFSVRRVRQERQHARSGGFQRWSRAGGQLTAADSGGRRE